MLNNVSARASKHMSSCHAEEKAEESVEERGHVTPKRREGKEEEEEEGKIPALLQYSASIPVSSHVCSTTVYGSLV